MEPTNTESPHSHSLTVWLDAYRVKGGSFPLSGITFIKRFSGSSDVPSRLWCRFTAYIHLPGKITTYFLNLHELRSFWRTCPFLNQHLGWPTAQKNDGDLCYAQRVGNPSPNKLPIMPLQFAKKKTFPTTWFNSWPFHSLVGGQKTTFEFRSRFHSPSQKKVQKQTPQNCQAPLPGTWFRRSHRSIQLWWKLWLQGSRRSFSPPQVQNSRREAVRLRERNFSIEDLFGEFQRCQRNP